MKLDRNVIKKLLFLISFAIVLFMVLNNLSAVSKVFSQFLKIMTPIIIGIAFAFVLNVPLRFIEHKIFRSKNKVIKAIKRPVSILLSFVIIIVILTLVLNLVIPELVKTFQVLVDIVPKFVNNLKDNATGLYNKYPEIQSWVESANEKGKLSDTIMDTVKNSAGGFLGSTIEVISSIFNGVVNMVVGLIFSAYILANKERLKAQCKKMFIAWFPEKFTKKFFHICSISDTIFRKFVVGQITEAVILGTLCTLGMLLFKFPYAGMVGALVGITALIPIVGAFIGAGVGAFMIMMQDPFQALLFIIFIIVLQQIEGNLIYPRVVGSSVGLPAMWVLAAVTVGGGLLGIVGMLAGVPIASVLYTLLKEDINGRYNKKMKDKPPPDDAGDGDNKKIEKSPKSEKSSFRAKRKVKNAGSPTKTSDLTVKSHKSKATDM